MSIKRYERSMTEFRYQLSAMNWRFSNCNTLDEKFDAFDLKNQNCFNKCFSVKTKQVSTKKLNKPWIPNAIKISIKTKFNYFKLFWQGLISRKKNGSYKKLLNKIIRSEKRRYFWDYFTVFKQNVKKISGWHKKVVTEKW